MRTTLLIAALILCMAGPAAAQKDSILKKKLYKTWLAPGSGLYEDLLLRLYV